MFFLRLTSTQQDLSFFTFAIFIKLLKARMIPRGAQRPQAPDDPKPEAKFYLIRDPDSRNN